MPAASSMIGYYVHHHGFGHLARARCIAAASHEPVTVLSSLPAPDVAEPFAQWLTLPADDSDVERIDVEAGGALHWAPLRAPGYRRRMAIISHWLQHNEPSAVVVDVSVEVVALVRLLGFPVVVIAGPGNRDDDVHHLGYRMAARIVAPWPAGIYTPDHLRRYASKVDYVGAISRFDNTDGLPTSSTRQVVALFGGGGSDVTEEQLGSAQAATPGWVWNGFGGGQLPWSDDVWDLLQAASVVVTHAGQNMVAEVAAARRPAVLVPQRRPFEEQHTTAAALAAAGLAIQVVGWPSGAQWPALLTAAEGLGGGNWSLWNAGDGAARAAAAIDAVAGDA